MATAQFDTNRKYVRVLETRANGMVEFEFAIGEPEIFAELIMPKAAFEEFCKSNAVTFLSGAHPVSADRDADGSDFDWTLREATHQRFR